MACFPGSNSAARHPFSRHKQAILASPGLLSLRISYLASSRSRRSRDTLDSVQDSTPALEGRTSLLALLRHVSASKVSSHEIMALSSANSYSTASHRPTTSTTSPPKSSPSSSTSSSSRMPSMTSGPPPNSNLHASVASRTPSYPSPEIGSITQSTSTSTPSALRPGPNSPEAKAISR